MGLKFLVEVVHTSGFIVLQFGGAGSNTTLIFGVKVLIPPKFKW